MTIPANRHTKWCSRRVGPLEKIVLITATAGAVCAVPVALAWEGGLRYYSAASRASVALSIALVCLCAIALGRHRQRETSRSCLHKLAMTARHPRSLGVATLVAIALWGVVISAVAGWDLYSFSRELHQLPTLSYLIGRVTRFTLGRACVFALWLITGCYLSVGSRRPRGARAVQADQR